MKKQKRFRMPANLRRTKRGRFQRQREFATLATPRTKN